MLGQNELQTGLGRRGKVTQKITAATINKQLSAVQAVMVWANENGLVADDSGWTDPVSKMRLPEDQSDRVPFDAADLQKIFNAPVFTDAKLPKSAKRAAGIWLPLVALFSGARQSEIAGLTVADVQSDAATQISYLLLTEQPKVGKRLKTKMSQRAIGKCRSRHVQPQAFPQTYISTAKTETRSAG